MPLTILTIILFIIFLNLSAIHFYWAFGGNWALKTAIPTKENSTNTTFKPSAFATLFVAIFLLFFALSYLIKSAIFNYELPIFFKYIFWGLPTLFLLRAIGDFTYVGFFKRIKHTTFGKWDSKLFSPLCLIISLLGFIILYLQ